MRALLHLLYTLLILTLFSTVIVADTISVSVSSSSDDAEEYVSSGSVNLTSSDLELGTESSEQIVGMRFDNVMLPKNATVSNAYIQFTVDETSSNDLKLVVYAQDGSNPPTFSDTQSDISDRPLTSRSVKWDVAAWTSEGDAGTNQQTPDLKDIVNDIQALDNWESGNAMVFIIKKDSSSYDTKRVADSYDGSSTSAPKLIIEYSLPDSFYAYNDTATAMPNSSITINVLENDIAGSGESLLEDSVVVTDNPQNGTVVVNSDGTITYYPKSGFEGIDSFYYTVDNTAPQTSNKAKVTVDVGYVVGDRDFTIRNPKETRNIRGNYAIGGNINLCTYSSNNPNCFFTTSNSYPSKYVDSDGNNSTVNSSSFDLNITDGSEVVWAGLYWQGVIHNSDDDDDKAGNDFGVNNLWVTDNTISNATKVDSDHKEIDLSADNNGHGTYGADKVKFKVPGKDYVTITAQQLDFYQLGYAGFADVTKLLNKTNPNGKYTVADIKSQIGVESSHGNYAAWSLVVIYKNDYEKFRNITLFDGFVTVDSHYTGDLVIDGFLTPRTPPVKSKLAFFTMDGDGGSNSLHIINQDGVDTEVEDPDHQNESLFNSTIEDGIIRDPEVPSARMDLDIIDLEDVLGTFNTKATLRPRSGGDRYTASFFIMSSELYVPEFCYDYAYKQQDVYFTEENNGTVLPRIPRVVGHVLRHEPVEVTVFLRNLVDSDIEVSDMKVDVIDINTSQLKYIRETTKLAEIGDLIPQPISDSDLAVSDSFIKYIDIGTIKSNDYFYIYYSLDPSISDINDSINVVATYNLNLDGTTIPYELTLGQNMKLCSTSNFKYAPAKGIFNIVHKNYYNYDEGGNNRYYNLPTQVTQRVGNFKVLSMDPDNLDDLKETSTIVAVERIDASAFHDTNTSCMEMASSISDRKWVIFDSNVTSTPFDNSIVDGSFYAMARPNTAFRITFNAMDENGTTPLVQKENDGSYTILNWRTQWDGQNCTQDMDGDGIIENDTVASYCNDTGNNPNTLAGCMECIYGKDIRKICSRDNFATRPEAFYLKIDDQNQSDSTQQQLPLTNGYTGSTTANAPVLHLAAGYKYNIEINATNHVDNNASQRYTRDFDELVIPQDMAEYSWDSSLAAGACNDESNKTLEIHFYNGRVDANSSVSQVGEYKLQLLDTTWTAVDSNPLFMTHHTSPYFTSTLDCVGGSSDTRVVNSSSLNGCNISSSHTNPTTSVKYNSFDIVFHPYAYAMTNNITLGGANTTPLQPGDANYFKPFVYMANIKDDEQISVHLNTTVTAKGYAAVVANGTTLTNYVDGCYATPLHLKVGKTATTSTKPSYSFIVHSKDKNGAIITANDLNGTIAAGDLNATPMVQTLPAYFPKDMNGTSSIVTNLNYNREVNVTVNPQDINYTTVSVDDNTSLFTADFNASMYPQGSVSVTPTGPQRVLHYYGKTVVPTTTVLCDTKPCRTGDSGTNSKALISFVVYCDPTTTLCTPATNLPNGSSQIADIRWHSNTNHDNAIPIGSDGVVGTVKEVTNTSNIQVIGSPTISQPNYEYETIVELQTSAPIPYDAIMEMNSSRWLISDPANAAATTNKFTVKFTGDGGWSGKYEENSTTDTSIFAPGANRRVIW